MTSNTHEDQPIEDECTHDWHYMEEPYAETMKCAHCGDTQR